MPEQRRISPNKEGGVRLQSGHAFEKGEPMTEPFNPTMMITARQLKDWNQADLAAQTCKTQAYISKVECRVLPPSDEFIKILAEKVGFPDTFFSQPGHMGGLPVSVHPMFRKQKVAEAKQTSKVRVLDRVNAEMSLRFFHLRVLQSAFAQHSQKFAEVKAVISESNGPEAAARAFRRVHHISSGPLPDLTHLAENSGILVYHCDFGDDTDEMVDGVSMHAPDLPPTIFLNKNRPADRLRFSLAHEICHIFCHKVPTDSMETEANDFAGELLLPEADVKILFSEPVSLYKLAAMKPEWRVSVQALLYRAGKLQAINDNTRNALWREITRLGWKKHEPTSLDFEAEHPALINRILCSVGDDLPRMLHTYPQKLKEMYQIAI